MSWTLDTSIGRARKRLDQVRDLTVTDVVRSVDFDTISLTNPRRVDGAHLYVDLPGFNALVRQSDLSEQAELVRLLHLWQRETTRIVKAFDGVKVHFQGPRLHAVFYLPIGDATERAQRVLLAAAAIARAAAIFADVLAVDAWGTASGIDAGRTVATRSGANGDRELLFLGNAANRAAKILDVSGIILTDTVADAVPKSLAGHLRHSGDRFGFLIGTELTDAVTGLGVSWSEEATAVRLIEAADTYPPGCVGVHEIAQAVDKEKLGISNTKSLTGATVFADVDGFTASVEAAMAIDEDLVDIIKQFHVLRGEGRDTAVKDFDSLRVQYQGDRMQVLTYLPVGDAEAVALKAVRLSAALHSVADQVLPATMPWVSTPTLATGIALGTGLLTRVGEHGNRDTVSISGATADAARIQQSLDGHQTGIDRSVLDRLPDWAAAAFSLSASARAYTSSGLTFQELCALEDAGQRDLASARTSWDPGAIRPGGLRPWHA